jgi:hypothetical protein
MAMPLVFSINEIRPKELKFERKDNELIILGSNLDLKLTKMRMLFSLS